MLNYDIVLVLLFSRLRDADHKLSEYQRSTNDINITDIPNMFVLYYSIQKLYLKMVAQ